MRKFRLVIAGAAAAMMLAACSSGGDGSATQTGGDSSTGGASGGGTLTIFSESGTKPGLDKAIEAFEKESGASIKVTYTESEQYKSTLRTQLEAKRAADVFYVWPGNGNTSSIFNLAPGGFLADLSSAPWSSQVPDKLDVVTSYEGARMALPMVIAGYTVMYNEDAVSKANAKVPTTWSELLAFCDAGKAAGVPAFGLGAQTVDSAQVIAFELAATLAYSAQPDLQQAQDDGTASFSSSGWVKALDQYKEMDERGCFNDKPVGTSVDVSNEMLANGQVMAQAQHTAWTPDIEAMAPEGTTFGFFGLPATDDPSQTWIPAGSADLFAVNANSSNMDLARKFVDFLAQPENRSQYATAVGAIPAIPVTDFESTAVNNNLAEFYNNGKYATFMDQLWPNADVALALKRGVQEILSDQSDVKTVIGDMDKAYGSQ